MLNELEREQRKKTLGASEVSKLFNFNNKTAVNLWREKMGLIEHEQFSNKYTVAGNLLEEDCLRFFLSGEYELNKRIEHRDVAGLIASTDAVIFPQVGNSIDVIPVECKTIGFDKFITLGDDLRKINRNYYIQLQTQIACCESEIGIILFNAVDEADYEQPLLYRPTHLKQHHIEVKKDDEMIQEIVSRSRYFLWCITYKRKPSESHYLATVLGGSL